MLTRRHLRVSLAYEYHGPPAVQTLTVESNRSASSTPRMEVVRGLALVVC